MEEHINQSLYGGRVCLDLNLGFWSTYTVSSTLNEAVISSDLCRATMFASVAETSNGE